MSPRPAEAKISRLGHARPAGHDAGDGGVSAQANVGDLGSILGSGRISGEGNANPFQYSCLGNSMDRETWWAMVHGVTK